MSKLFRHAVAVAGVAAMTTGLSACTANADTTKAGGAGPPTTLRIGTNDASGRPAAEQIEQFAGHVDDLTGGRIVIEVVAEVGGLNSDDWDQLVAEAITSGELDGGNIPTRAWDTEGVTSLRAITAPFLVTSNELMSAVATDDVADEMLAGLDDIGVTGLTLLPEGLRHVFAFDEPLLAPEDFAGAAIRSPMSATTYALLEALGAKPDDYPGPDAFSIGVADGTIAAAESSLALAGSLPDLSTVTGNLTFFPKINSLVLRSEAWDSLSDDDRAALLQAADLTQAAAITGLVDEAEAAAEFCTSGGTVVIADERGLDAFDVAAAPVTAMLREDPATAGFIDRIAALSTDIPAAAPVEPCAFDAPPVPTTTNDAPAAPVALEGIYRVEWTEQYLIDNGLADLAAAESGIHTITLTSNREVIDEYPNGRLCRGNYEVEGSAITIHFTSGCTGDFTAIVTADGDQLTMTDIVAIPPWNSAEDQHIVEVFWSLPWTRIADTDEPDARSAFPDGIYRLDVRAETVAAAGVPESEAIGYAGVWTLTFEDGTVVISERVGDCHGTYEIVDGRIEIIVGDDVSCGSEPNSLFFDAGWTVDDDQLSFVDLAAADVSAQSILVGIFASAPWDEIG